MTNKEVSQILEEIGTLLELKGENPFKCRAYHNASRVVAALTTDLATLIEKKELTGVKGIGEGLAEKITELVTTGKLKYYLDLERSLPPGLVDMLRIQGLGPKRVKLLYEQLKIKTVEELQKAAQTHRLAKLEGFGEKSEENILRGIEALKKHADKHLYSTAREAAEKILASIKSQKEVIRADIAGSLRRRKELIGDIDILASVKKGAAARIIQGFTSHPDVQRIIAKGETKASVMLSSDISCDLRVIAEKEYPFALAYFTGSKDHNVTLRSRAKDFGLSLNEYGFTRLEEGPKGPHKKLKRIPVCTSEEEIYSALGLKLIPPELRENTSEFEAAAEGKLPVLVTDEDIRGTFHCHTTASDGFSTLEEMVQAARALGWEYLGIADHSQAAAYARGLSPARVKQQLREIDILNEKLKGFRIFKGTEADILSDGSLDFSDAVLSSFEYVVASIHSKFGMTEAEATKRIIKALKNKHTTMLGHPTGRLLLERDGYPVDMIQVINAAADYGKMIEINAHPARLDLDWRFCSYAKEKGVPIVINPDAHDVGGLGDVSYGVGIARKGWLSRKDILNTQPLEAVGRLITQQRKG